MNVLIKSLEPLSPLNGDFDSYEWDEGNGLTTAQEEFKLITRAGEDIII